MHSVLPWYHEKWIPAARGYTRVAPRKKFRNAEHREITSRASWEALKSDIAAGANVERLLINPDNSDIVRDRNFVEDLAQLANQRHIIVELSGGLLSHAFYMLSKYGCDVECVDLFAIEEEQLEFNKIVRDEIPATIAERGESVEVVKVCGDALLEALKRKLVEEALEAFDANTSEAIIEELADVREAIDGILGTLGLSSEQLQSSKDRKKKKRGGFGNGLMLVRTSLSPSLQPQIEDSENPQMRSIKVVAELPRSEAVFNSDLRRDANATPERQITITLPADGQRYRSAQHRIDVPTLSGESHELSFEAQLERQGSMLKVKVLLSNAPEQVAFDFSKAPEEGSKK